MKRTQQIQGSRVSDKKQKIKNKKHTYRNVHPGQNLKPYFRPNSNKLKEWKVHFWVMLLELHDSFNA